MAPVSLEVGVSPAPSTLGPPPWQRRRGAKAIKMAVSSLRSGNASGNPITLVTGCDASDFCAGICTGGDYIYNQCVGGSCFCSDSETCDVDLQNTGHSC